MHEFVGDLLRRYRALREVGTISAAETAAVDERLTELLLAEAALRYERPTYEGRPRRPLQLAVLGPTQTGKSTIVNLILGARVAEVSPLAGFTTHAQGFWIASDESDESWTAELFPGWQRREPEELSRNELDCYALTITGETPVPPTGETPVPPKTPAAPARPATSPEDVLSSEAPLFAQGPATSENAPATRAAQSEPPAGLPPCVVWDTPDFDSLASHAYRRGVLEVAALADVHVFVLSKEKYSDLSVWRMLRLLQPLGCPLVICLNKLTPDAAETVTASLRQRLQAVSGQGAPIITFEYQPGLDAAVVLEPLPEVWELRDRVAARLKAARSADRSAGLKTFVRQHWADWIAPIEVELAAADAWNGEVEAALREALETYRRDFLDHPQRFDSFRRATAELLHLLELPGIAGALGQVRQVLSWPARRLLAAGQAWSARRRKGAGVPRGPGSEEVVLSQIVEKLLTGLERDAARRCDPATPGHSVWRALAGRLEQHDARLRETFQSAARRQREEFAPEIQKTANQLYERLQEKPALLNTLRAARATTELGLIALTVKTGGLGVNDLLFAPAMFALTSMLTEGVLGSYMTHTANELKKRQLEHVRTSLIEGVFAKELRELAADLQGADLFGVSAQQLAAAARALDVWEGNHDE